jgi:glycosyltransferase involved in cell wall biosynthesis
MAIVFFKSGRWSGTNDAVERVLRQQFPDERLVIADAWAELKRKPIHLAWLLAVGAVQLRPPLHLGRGEYGFFQYSRDGRKALRRIALASAARQLGGERPRFTFQAPARFFAHITGVPHFCYVDTTEALKPLGPSGRRTRVETAVLGLESELFTTCARNFTHAEPITRSIVADYGVRPDRAVTVYGGTNLDPSVPTADVTGGRQRILFIAVEWERKGGDLLVEAFGQVRNRFPRAELHIVGIEPKAQVDGCVFHGPQTREQVLEQLQHASVFCLPSRLDFFPNVVREAMWCGVPVVATRNWWVPEVIKDGESCVFVPTTADGLAEGLTRLLGDAELRSRIGLAGREVARAHFTWEAVGAIMKREILSQLP